MKSENFCVYEGPPVPDHLAPGLGRAGRRAVEFSIKSRLSELDRERQELLTKLDNLRAPDPSE